MLSVFKTDTTWKLGLSKYWILKITTDFDFAKKYCNTILEKLSESTYRDKSVPGPGS